MARLARWFELTNHDPRRHVEADACKGRAGRRRRQRCSIRGTGSFADLRAGTALNSTEFSNVPGQSTSVGQVMGDVDTIRSDLVAEGWVLDGLVATLEPEAWSTPTPSPGWTVADQIGHLAAVDWRGALAISNPEQFVAEAKALMKQVGETGDDSFMLEEPRAMSPAQLLDWWRRGRQELVDASMGLDGDSRLAWYGPPMGAQSFLTARLMETWAHGRDVADAFGVVIDPTPRLRHIAHLGVITRSFVYKNRGLEPPEGDIRVELTGPGDTISAWGPPDADQAVQGPIEDFCLVVTQRRNVADTGLELTGDLATDWMSKAQAFAGPPTNGPVPTNYGAEGADGDRG